MAISNAVTLANLDVGASVSVGDTPPANPEAGDQWFSTTNGENTLYVYYDDGESSQWVISVPSSGSGGGGGGDEYLPLTGGELTGPLTSTSTIAAAGAITAEPSFGSGRKTLISDSSSSGAVKIFDDTVTKKLELRYDGSADFAGNDISLNADGSITAAGNIDTPRLNLNSSASSNMLVGYDGTTPNVILKASGNLTLGDDNIQLNGDSGSITAAGVIRAGGNSSSGGEAGVYVSDTGFIAAARDGANDAVWRSFTAGSNTEMLAITAGGSIIAKGEIVTNGQILVNRTDAGIYVLEGQDNGTQTSLIKRDGSIIAAGTVTANGYSMANLDQL